MYICLLLNLDQLNEWALSPPILEWSLKWVVQILQNMAKVATKEQKKIQVEQDRILAQSIVLNEAKKVGYQLSRGKLNMCCAEWD